ncbi:MAG: hypothetical protein IKE65_07475 [Clostridia bacterium]|nr:hypothetical protein [Clostridia bacterium]
MKTPKLVVNNATFFYEKSRSESNGRYLSWEHCYKVFHDARSASRVDYDLLSLHLAFYLASWGMYRGSSFLLQKDYKVHTPVVKEILKPKYDCLFGVDCAKLREENIQNALNELTHFLLNYYAAIRQESREKKIENKVSDTLITKILMGTLGCVPAYDRFFIDGIKSQKVSTGTYNLKSLMKLVDFYEMNFELFEKTRAGLFAYDIQYPQMKLLDMGFWQIGYEIDNNKKTQA